MAALHVDHNVSSQLALLLRRAGHDVIETRVIGMSRATDDALLLAAADGGRVFITYNEADFVLLHDAWRRWSAAWGVNVAHAGILVLPQPPHLANSQAAQALDSFLLTSIPLASELYLFRRAEGWRQRPATIE
jgi:hypothetical protein